MNECQESLTLPVNLDNQALLSRRDPSNMLGAIDQFPDHFLNPPDVKEIRLRRRFGVRNLVLMGMGGSASSGDVVVDWLSDELTVPAVVHRDPRLPRFLDSRTVFVAISYSGNTLETLDAFRAAKKRGCRLCGIGNGGELSELCDQFGAPFVRVKSAIAPRAALGQLVAATASVLAGLGLVRTVSREMIKAGTDLAVVRKRCQKETPISRNPAKLLASKMLGHLVVLYSLQRMSSVVRRFKNQLAENSKTIAKYDLLPESCHNEIEAWRGEARTVLPIVIRDSNESVFERAAIGAFTRTIRPPTASGVETVRLLDTNHLSRLLAPIFFLDYVSVYLAVLRGVDPTPNTQITKYKTQLVV